MKFRWRIATIAGLALFAVSGYADAEQKLKVYLLCGQSNMEGHGYTHQEGDDWLESIRYPDATAIEYLLNNPDYVKSLDKKTYTFLAAFNDKWIQPRTDVWAIHMDSVPGTPFVVQHTKSDRRSEWNREEKPLQPGFGNAANNVSKFGPELGFGHTLGEALDSPIYLYKSDHGGTALATAWRPPSAAKARGGEVGACYTNTLRTFSGFLSELGKTLASDGKLAKYGGATGYEVCGLLWVQGFNDSISDEKRAEYEQNMIDLGRDLRRDLKLPKLPIIVVESSDGNAEMNTARQNAVAALNKDQPGQAVFISTQGLNQGKRGGFHFEARAENYLEIGWRAAQAALKHGYTGSEKVEVE